LDHPRFGFFHRAADGIYFANSETAITRYSARRSFEMGDQPQNRRHKEKQNDQPDDRRRDPQRGGDQPNEPSDSSRWHSWTIG
jgi:hypothetical protein